MEFLSKNKIKEKMLSTDEYINWLCEFTKNQRYIDSEFLEWAGDTSEYSKNDINQINKINIFVETIFDTIKTKNINEYAYIKYHDNYFIISIKKDQGLAYVQRLNCEIGKSINYCKVIKDNNKNLERKSEMGKIEKTLLIALISIGILGTSFMVGMGIKQNIEKAEDKSYSDTYDKDSKVKTLRR